MFSDNNDMEARTKNIVLCKVQSCVANLEPSGTVISFVPDTGVTLLETIFVFSYFSRCFPEVKTEYFLVVGDQMHCFCCVSSSLNL